MASGRCVQIVRRAFQVGPYTFLRQSAKVNGKAWYVFYVEVSKTLAASPSMCRDVSTWRCRLHGFVRCMALPSAWKALCILRSHLPQACQVQRLMSTSCCIAQSPVAEEFHQRNVADGFRVQWDFRNRSLELCGSLCVGGETHAKSKPAFVGYGITSDPMLDCSYDSLLVAAQLAVKEPWRAIE